MREPDHALYPSERRKVPRWERRGLSPRAERIFNVGAVVLLCILAAGWIYVIRQALVEGVTPAGVTSVVTVNPLSPESPPETPYLLDAAARAFVSDTMLRGYSGAVRVYVQPPGDTLLAPREVPSEVEVQLTPVQQGGPTGVWNVMLRMRDAIMPVPNFTVLTLTPLSEKRGGRIGSYVIGSWPYETGGKPRTPAYAPPAGLVRVTPENMNTPVSEHFVLGDFLTKGQRDVWPKYVAMSPRLLDKLELTIQQLEANGHPVEHVGVISGFRTPTYNEGGGNPAGRGALSRHMYGDAMDWYVDNDRNGRMDDLNGDGRIDIRDAQVIAQAAEQVEKKYPSLIGGIGIYRPTGAHSGFVHLDTRGYRARW